MQAAGQVFLRLGGTPYAEPGAMVMPLAGMALTYFFVNTIPIAIAIALTTNQSAWRIWKTDFASSAPSYLLGAAAAAVVIKVTESSGYWLTLLLTAAPLYLTYRMYRVGRESEARQGAILEAAHDAIITMDFFRDITERRALEEQLRQSQKLEAIGRLAGGVAHDFNNILMSIMGAADLLLMQLTPGDSAREEATEIKQSVDRGAGLTRQLLAFSRRQATRPRLFALGEVVSGMDRMLRRLIEAEIDFEIISAPYPLMILADSGQVEQVVMNLVINARDAMPKGGRLTVRVEEVELNEAAAATLTEGKTGLYARLSVADTGTGIDEQTRAKLFEPFFTTKEQGKGTGLGLSIVYGIVKQSGGYITVASEPGRGATFLLYFPIATAPEPAPAVA